MKAVAVGSYGDEPVVMEIPMPEPASREVRVRLTYAGVNPLDWKAASGWYKDSAPADFPFVTGTDGAGVVDAVGEGSRRFAPGDRVFGEFRHSPLGHGTEAQYVVAPETAPIARTPDGLDDDYAAAMPTAGLAALGLLDALGLENGARLLIVGATGGIGHYMTQLAADRGIDVIVTARPASAREMMGLGAVATVDHTSSVPVAAQVLGMDPAGVDAYVDLVNPKETVTAIASALRHAGKVVSSIGQADASLLGPMGLEAIAYRSDPTAEKLAMLAEMAVEGRLKVPLEQVVPLDKAADVLAESRTGHMHGKTVLEIP